MVDPDWWSARHPPGARAGPAHSPLNGGAPPGPSVSPPIVEGTSVPLATVSSKWPGAERPRRRVYPGATIADLAEAAPVPTALIATTSNR